MFSGKIILNFGVQKRLRAFLYPIFTGGVVAANGICIAAFCESAALRGKVFAEFQRAEPSQSSLRDASSPEGGSFISAYRQMRKSSPFGGAGCDHREQTERVRSPWGELSRSD